MFIASKRNIILPSADGSKSFRVQKDYIGEIPDWAADTPYFRALVADGKISAPESHSDQDVEKAGRGGRRGNGRRRGGENTETAETASESESAGAAAGGESTGTASGGEADGDAGTGA